jgi:hypothetical protein
MATRWGERLEESNEVRIDWREHYENPAVDGSSYSILSEDLGV